MDALRANGRKLPWQTVWRGRLPALAVLIACLASWTAAGAADRPADSSSAASAEKSADPVPPRESLLGAVTRALGPRFSFIFFGLTTVLVALAVANVLAVRRDGIVPRSLVQGLEERLADDRFQEACDLVRGDQSMLGRVLAAGLPHLIAGDARAAKAMEEFGSLESIKMHARLGHVWLVAQLAPLFGLLGTIDGLIATFDSIVQKGASPRPFDLAAGIGLALVATTAGLWIAVVAVAVHHIVLGRLNRLLAEAGILAERFAEQFAAARKP